MKSYLLIPLIIFLSTANNGSSTDESAAAVPPHQKETEWVDQVFNRMTDEERLGQLFMIRAYSNDKATTSHIAQVKRLIEDHHVGGLCFFQGTPERQAELTNQYQQLATQVPLMISMDAEWGLGMRLKSSTISFPRQLTLGAIRDNRLIYEMGKEIARQCRRLGVHINFAPVADVNNNPKNPVINYRSFGEDRYNVAVKSYLYMKGMQDGRVMACAKHFPGHGDTDTDSHYDLPIITHDRQRLDSIELFPFRVLAEQGVQSMMVAHLHVPNIDSTRNLPTTLSANAVTDLLKKELGYDGLIFTDGLGMKGVTKHHKTGEVEAKALQAGNDILLLPQNVPAAIKAIQQYISEGKISQTQLHASVKRVLHAKYRLGLTQPQRVELANLRQDLNATDAFLLKKQLTENALTLVRDDDGLVPFREINNNSIAILSLGAKSRTPFQNQIAKYATLEQWNVGIDIPSGKQKTLVEQLGRKKVVVVSLHDMSSHASKGFGVSHSQKALIEALSQKTKLVLIVFGNPYALQYFDHVNTVLVAHDEEEITQQLVAQSLLGVFSIRGQLPVTASAKSRFGDGITTNPLFRMAYDLPESVGLDGQILQRGIDSLADVAIRLKATPGCVVLIAKDGKIVFNKAYGHHTYSKRRPLATTDLFDLASITKIAATTLAVMKLHEEGKINIYQPISQYLPELKGTNKAHMTIENIMAHRAGLIAWIPFYEQTVSGRRSPRPSSKYYKKVRTKEFNTPVTERLYMLSTFEEEIRKQIRESDLRATRDYKYSDLGFYMLADLVHHISGQPLDEYVDQHFYHPMGLTTTTFTPREKFAAGIIVPSEEDKYFRRQTVQGNVHDMGAAMLGGVSGHAGLFSNAVDLVSIMQMLLNDGYYGGRQYLKSSTVRTFISRHKGCTRRGIGFDMKELDAYRSQNMCPEASTGTFGHLGFTGTSAWADPEHNLVFLFLSNRTYPSMHNYKLNKEDIRPKMQSVVYRSMGR